MATHRDGRPSRYLANECVNRQINLPPRRRSCFRSSFRRYPGVSADISRSLQAQAYAPPARLIGNVRQFRRFKWTRSGSYIPSRSKMDSAAGDIAAYIRGHCRGRGWRVDRVVRADAQAFPSHGGWAKPYGLRMSRRVGANLPEAGNCALQRRHRFGAAISPLQSAAIPLIRRGA